MELLKRLYGIHSPSGKEKRMRNFINAYITENVPGARIMVDNTGNLFITKGEAETYPCLAAHLDQVQRYRSQDFRAVETHDIIFILPLIADKRDWGLTIKTGYGLL